jgi:hypothetical protein
MFQIIKVNKQSIRVVSLASKDKQYTINLARTDMVHIQQGMILSGEIGKGTINAYEINHLNNVYPWHAVKYV